MKFYKLNCVVGIEAGDDADPEDIAATFSRGLDAAVAHFPDAEVWGAEVDSIEPMTDEERNKRGWVE